MTDPVCRIWVPGIPAPGGSKRGFAMRVGSACPLCKQKKLGRILITDASKGAKDWKENVVLFARQRGGYHGDPLEVALHVRVRFFMPRPKYHYRSGKFADQLKPNPPKYHEIKPDASKLWRPAEDALTKIVWKDDALIVSQDVKKFYELDFGTGMTVEVFRILESEDGTSK